MTASPVKDPQGRIIGASAIARDISERKRSEEALRNAETRYADLIDSVRAVVWRADARTFQPTFTSKHVQEILGYTAEYCMTTPGFWVDRIHPDDRERVLAATTSVLAELRKHEFEYRLLASDGTPFWLRNIVNVVVENGEPVELVGIAVDISERKKAKAAMAGLGGRLLEAQEGERRHIARELHDDVGQHLAILALEMQRLEDSLPDGSPLTLRDTIRKSARRIVEIGSSIHALSHRLHSSKLEILGLLNAMKAYCQEFSAQQGVGVEFTHQDVPRDLPQDVSLCLFRILQEGLLNARKHSGGRNFKVHLRCSGGQVHLTIRDSGVGFDFAQALQKKDLGLVSMRERVALLNGDFSISSRPQFGTEINARLPIAAPRAATP